MFLSILFEKKPTETPQHSGPHAYTHIQVHPQKTHIHNRLKDAQPLPLRGESSPPIRGSRVIEEEVSGHTVCVHHQR